MLSPKTKQSLTKPNHIFGMKAEPIDTKFEENKLHSIQPYNPKQSNTCLPKKTKSNMNLLQNFFGENSAGSSPCSPADESIVAWEKLNADAALRISNQMPQI